MEIGSLIEKARVYLPAEKLSLIEEAYQFALNAHQGQLRESGEPYMQHPLETAVILVDMGLDASSLAAALLHDVPEDCGVPLSEIEARFGSEVSKLVDGVTKLGKISWKRSEKLEKEKSQAESLRKMLVAMAEDLRVIFIKLADRLHNMRTLGALTNKRQQTISSETLEIYVPLAHRLGMWRLKGRLEDLSFFYINPQKYRQIELLANMHGAEHQGFIARAIDTLEKELEKNGLKAEVTGRSKNLYSIYQKLERYSAQGKDFIDIHDILALRVLVDKVADCYHALGAIHSLWHPLRDEFDDYIANPKENDYRSLHTTVMCFGTTPLEIQIRTYEMHSRAEYGVAAHWTYKEGIHPDTQFEQRIAWLRQLMDWHTELGSTAEFLESVKTDIFKNQAFVYTPKGEIKDMPAGSTPLDFAYRIHTDLGHRCIGAKVNGRLVPLTYLLRNGDTVEIITTKKEKGPSRDWLNPNLGFIKTTHARDKVRQWFSKQARAENIQQGREILDKELHRLGIDSTNREEIASLFKYESADEFYAAIGCGDISTSQIAFKFATQHEQPKVVDFVPHPKAVPSNVQVMGTGQLLTHLAHCCNPLPGDEIIGYITRSRGVSIHRRDCRNITNEDEKERLVPVEWGDLGQLYPVVIRVDAWDRVGLIRDISTLVAEEGINITTITSDEHDDRTTSIFLTMETRSISQLSRLLSRLEGVSGVITVTRNVEGVKGVEIG
jgi:GTP pyrophosphokinase